jgi:hypothetical protein
MEFVSAFLNFIADIMTCGYSKFFLLLSQYYIGWTPKGRMSQFHPIWNRIHPVVCVVTCSPEEKKIIISLSHCVTIRKSTPLALQAMNRFA